MTMRISLACEAYMRSGKKCGRHAKYELCEPNDEPVPICGIHQSRASGMGWKTRKRSSPTPSDTENRHKIVI